MKISSYFFKKKEKPIEIELQPMGNSANIARINSFENVRDSLTLYSAGSSMTWSSYSSSGSFFESLRLFYQELQAKEKKSNLMQKSL